MEKKIDLIVFLLSYVNELLVLFLYKYSKYLLQLQPIFKFDNILFINDEAMINYNIGTYVERFFYFLSIVYLFDIIMKYYNNKCIEIKKNTLFILGLFFCDCFLYFFNIHAQIIESHAFRFVIICLLTNLVVYIKYKKNNIKIE